MSSLRKIEPLSEGRRKVVPGGAPKSGRPCFVEADSRALLVDARYQRSPS
jgi:hypothetical protein